ncbi:multidrug transporter, partial [Staphylococcus pseudintermedius]
FMSFNAFLNLLTELTVIVFFYSTLLITNWKITLVFTLIISIQIFIITKKITVLIQKKGEIAAKSRVQTLKVFSKFFSNFKITKLKDNHEEAKKLFRKKSRKAHDT